MSWVSLMFRSPQISFLAFLYTFTTFTEFATEIVLWIKLLNGTTRAQLKNTLGAVRALTLEQFSRKYSHRFWDCYHQRFPCTDDSEDLNWSEKVENRGMVDYCHQSYQYLPLGFAKPISPMHIQQSFAPHAREWVKLLGSNSGGARHSSAG